MEIKKALIALSKELNANFTLHNRPIGVEEVFADTGLLPAMARRADQLCSLCLGYGIGATFNESEKAILGVNVVFDDVTPKMLRILCLTDVIYELIDHSPIKNSVPLDELMYD